MGSRSGRGAKGGGRAEGRNRWGTCKHTSQENETMLGEDDEQKSGVTLAGCQW